MVAMEEGGRGGCALVVGQTRSRGGLVVVVLSLVLSFGFIVWCGVCISS
jgi:hypothetical protein